MFSKLKIYFFLLSVILFIGSFSACNNGVGDTNSNNGENPEQVSYDYSTPTNVTVSASSSKANTVTVKWNAVENDEITYYWIYYNTTDSTANLTTPNEIVYSGLYVDDGIGHYDVSLPESGIYYFWVRASNSSWTSSATKLSDFSDVKSYEFTYTSLTIPTNVAVVKNSAKANCVKVTWTASDANYYWIYYNTTNDSSSAIEYDYAIAGLYVRNGSGSYDVILEETGTYYFWVRAANGTSSTSGTSDFSESATYAFTYTELTTPTNVAVVATDSANEVKVTWTASDANYYWIYYSTSNDSSSAIEYAQAIAGLYVRDGSGYYKVSLPSSGTYYFWVKAANTCYSSSKTSKFSEASDAYSFTYTE